MLFCKPAKQQQQYSKMIRQIVMIRRCVLCSSSVWVCALKRKIDSPHCDKWRLMNRIGHFSHIYPRYFCFLCIVFWLTPRETDNLTVFLYRTMTSIFYLIDVPFFVRQIFSHLDRKNPYIHAFSHARNQTIVLNLTNT